MNKYHILVNNLVKHRKNNLLNLMEISTVVHEENDTALLKSRYIIMWLVSMCIYLLKNLYRIKVILCDVTLSIKRYNKNYNSFNFLEETDNHDQCGSIFIRGILTKTTHSFIVLIFKTSLRIQYYWKE